MFKPTSGLSPGVTKLAQVSAATLSTEQRRNLDKSQFVFPDKAPGPGSCPIPDRAHAEKALQLCTPKDAVKRKVCSKFPSMPACQDGGDD